MTKTHEKWPKQIWEFLETFFFAFFFGIKIVCLTKFHSPRCCNGLNFRKNANKAFLLNTEKALKSVKMKKKKISTTTSCSGPIPGQKSWVIQYYGAYFPTRCPKWILIIFIVLVEKKHTKLIYHMPWLH